MKLNRRFCSKGHVSEEYASIQPVAYFIHVFRSFFKHKGFLGISIFLSICSYASNIYIPDANFKNYLLSEGYDTDIPSDNEISTDEAAAVNGVLLCANQNIADLTGIEGFVNITALYCYNNQLTSLPDLSPLTQLRALNCGGNLISEMPHLCELVLLEELTVIDNELEDLPIIDNLPNLWNFSCQLNNFEPCDLPAIYLIEQMPHITQFSYNPQKTGPDLICPVSPDPPPNLCFSNTPFKLKLLSITGIDTNQDGQISVLEAQNYSGIIDATNGGFDKTGGLEYFSKTTGVWVGYNALTLLPPLCRMTALTTFSATDNLLVTLPDVSCLSNLTSLDVSENQLSTLPKLSNLIQLAGIYCASNQLSALPYIGDLHNLEILSCDENKINQFPDLPIPSKLKIIQFSLNHLVSIPDISGHPFLEYVNIGNNFLHIAPQFSNLPSLMAIYLYDNQLIQLHPLTEIPSILTLDLSGNRLSELPLDWESLPNLQALSLIGNNLEQLPDLEPLVSLTHLYCSNNHLTVAPRLWPGMTTALLDRNLLDESQCEVLMDNSVNVSGQYSYSPQGGIFLFNDEWPQWPGNPSPLLEWTVAVSNVSFEYDLICN